MWTPLLRCSLPLLIGSVTIALGPGCVRGRVADHRSSPPTEHASTTLSVAGVDENQGPPLWYKHVLQRDVTGDGRAESLVLRAYGTRGDSLQILFTIMSGGDEVFRTTWQSESELVDPPLPSTPSRAALDSFMRVRLDAFFNRLDISSVDTSAIGNGSKPSDCPNNAADCRAIVDDIRRNTKYQLTFSYGYESIITIAWSERFHRFVEIAACC